LPLNPSNGNWSTTADVGDFSPGTLVPENTKLTIHCNDEYTLFGENTTVCAKTSWTPALGTCLKTCPPIRSPFVFPECDLDGRPVNCTNALNGTTTKFSCHHPYEVPNKNKKDSAVCINGIWVENIPSCVPGGYHSIRKSTIRPNRKNIACSVRQQKSTGIHNNQGNGRQKR
jgi:hypothetical protein